MSLMMRVLTGVALVSAYLLLQVQFAAADGIGGWPLLHWGMSKQQVERVYPNFENFDHMFPAGMEKVFGLREYDARSTLSCQGRPLRMYGSPEVDDRIV